MRAKKCTKFQKFRLWFYTFVLKDNATEIIFTYECRYDCKGGTQHLFQVALIKKKMYPVLCGWSFQ